MSTIDVEKKEAPFVAASPEEMMKQQSQFLDSQVEVLVRHCLAELSTQIPRGKIIGEVRFCNKQPHVVEKTIDIFSRLGWRVALRKRIFRGNPSLVFSKGEASRK